MLLKSSLDFLTITKVISIDWCASQCSTKNETEAKMEQNYFKDTGLVIDEAGKADLHALE